MNLRFSKAQHLVRQTEFESVRENGTKFVGRFFICQWLPSPDGKRRIGFITSRKVGSAVIRNRARRRLREVYRTHQQQLTKELLVVLVARPAIVHARFQEIESEWMKALEKMQA